jgi:arsenite methyltransferase
MNIRPKTNTCSGPESGPECCPETKPAVDSDAVRDKVREGYGEIARSGQWSGVASLPIVNAPAAESCAPGGGCCGPATLTADQVALAVGYGANELAALPAGANLGLSCGNPTALASLKPGERVLDLGSGGGLDCFLAGRAVGATGRVIGVDMTPDMLARARKNLATYRQKSGLDNVEFRLGEIEHLPVEDGGVDVVISNCVLNLSPDKKQVWRDIARVLARGGRVAVSDIALLKPLPPAVKADVEALVGCVAGAALVSEIESAMRDAGLSAIELKAKPEYVAAMTNAGDPLYEKIRAALPRGETVADYVTSLDIAARKA